jgi:hypothetical protein
MVAPNPRNPLYRTITMTAEALEHLIRIAPRGSTITIVSIPGENDRVHVTERPKTDGELTAGPPSTPAEAVERLKQSGDARAFKPDEWAAHLPGISEREIKRAIKAGAVSSFAKGTGRDHGAVVISPDAMLDYLRAREGVARGMAKPGWYDDVVKY